MDCSPPSSSVHEICKARVLEWVAISFSRESSQPRDRTQVSRIVDRQFTAREFQKNIYFCFIDYAKAFDCLDHKEMWKILQEMGLPDHLTCLLSSQYAGQEATVRTGNGTTDWFQIGKGVRQSCHPAYLTYMQSTS